MDRIKREPAVVISILAAALLAAVQTAVGEQVVSADIGDVIAQALDPGGGWLYLILIGLVTRFFVSPASQPGV
jgi:hypothetical protein